MANRIIAGIDLFCGAGGLTYGLRKAGICIVAGIDIDPTCEYPYTSNNDARFIKADVREIKGKDLINLYPKSAHKLLAGCAPCQPFSPFRRGGRNYKDEDWSLLREFGRLIFEIKPELVTMENVPDLASKRIFRNFVRALQARRYSVDWKSVYCPPFGIPQHRRRLVLVASLIGQAHVPTGHLEPDQFKTVRDTIAILPRISAGNICPSDRLHKARSLSDKNLRRMRSSRPGGTWREWSRSLRAPCHRKRTGASYQSVYARMDWDTPSPTITTLAYNFGTGRFGHPSQDRAITLREAALLQSFPRKYRFVKGKEPVYFLRVGRLIGNAVPPRLAYFIGKELVRTARNGASSGDRIR